MDTIFEELAPVTDAGGNEDPGRGMLPMGGDIVPKVLGKHAWVLLGKPNRPGITLW